MELMPGFDWAEDLYNAIINEHGYYYELIRKGSSNINLKNQLLAFLSYLSGKLN